MCDNSISSVLEMIEDFLIPPKAIPRLALYRWERRGWHWVMSRHCMSISCARHQGGETRQRQESWGDGTVLAQCVYPLVPATWGLEVVTAGRKGCSTGLGHLPFPSKWHGLPFYCKSIISLADDEWVGWITRFIIIPLLKIVNNNLFTHYSTSQQAKNVSPYSAVCHTPLAATWHDDLKGISFQKKRCFCLNGWINDEQP